MVSRGLLKSLSVPDGKEKQEAASKDDEMPPPPPESEAEGGAKEGSYDLV